LTIEPDRRTVLPMKRPIQTLRTNLVLDEHLLAEALGLSGERTCSGADGRAPEDFDTIAEISALRTRDASR
jgi:hypothetical protein